MQQRVAENKSVMNYFIARRVEMLNKVFIDYEVFDEGHILDVGDIVSYWAWYLLYLWDVLYSYPAT